MSANLMSNDTTYFFGHILRSALRSGGGYASKDYDTGYEYLATRVKDWKIIRDFRFLQYMLSIRNVQTTTAQ